MDLAGVGIMASLEKKTSSCRGIVGREGGLGQHCPAMPTTQTGKPSQGMATDETPVAAAQFLSSQGLVFW